MTATAVLLGSFTILLFLRVPISLCLVFPSILTALYLGIPLEVVGQQMLSGLNSFSMMAIPLFILAGEIMGQGGLSQRLVQFSNLLVGRLRGGLAIVNVLSTMFFGGITGSAVADASAIGGTMIPMMRMRGYDKDFSVAVTITGSIQGILLPPSHNMILYSLVAGGVSIPALFAAGLVPGIGLGLALMVASYVIAVKRRYPPGDKIPRETWRPIIINGLISLTPIIIIVIGILGGIFTANESSAIAVVYALLMVTLVFKEVNGGKLHQILIETFRRLAVIMFLIAASAAFSWIVAYLQLSEMVLNLITQITTSKVGVFLLINVALLILGTLMEMAPLIVITTPILLPIAIKYGMDPVQFGVMLLLNLGIGLLSPPVGAPLFVGCAIGGITMGEAFKAMIPFLIIMLIMLLLITYIPGITMFLPNLLIS
ncbi:TRAP transporter large permease [Neomoorella humiferrea]|uniref:TRAP transporter large permease n=1 Tax=Neomoorella humiferrea TaxID=676965 RepID=UPI0030D19685